MYECIMKSESIIIKNFKMEAFKSILFLIVLMLTVSIIAGVGIEILEVIKNNLLVIFVGIVLIVIFLKFFYKDK